MEQEAFTNHLINETSPYLLQHAHNPVDWYPWGDEAFEKAREENKPVLLSIGYSACHWCHVMAHESFEDEQIAELMNENFVNIKVDREERPDLDQIYMNAVQMMTHHGGWPMTVFLTPEGLPFYAGTYFPPVDRHNMPGFPRVLVNLAEAYRERPDDVTQTSVSVLGELQRLGVTTASNEPLSVELLDSAYAGILRNYDSVNGGFGGAPKFPPAMALEFLLRTHYRTGKKEAVDVVRNTCRKMTNGGIYDQLGGGFHRYSVDAHWLVPHFEKMLYDNALLSRLYLHLYQVTRDDSFRRVAEETLDYVVREMTDAGGGFYSTQDADSEGHEGKFFVWSWAEILEALGKEDGNLFCDYFNTTATGNFEGQNILHITAAPEDVASRHNVSLAHLQSVIEGGRKRLFALRELRIKPARDEKILTAWNGMMLASFAEASAILERPDYRKVAEANAEFLLTQLQRDGLLLRTCKNGKAKLNGYLEDYACLIDGLVCLYETTGEFGWLNASVELTDKMIGQFWDEAQGAFFFTGASHEQLIVRSKDFLDNATPSGNSVAALALLKLSALTGNADYRRRATTVLRLISDQVKRYPSAFGWALCALDFYLSSPKEIAIVGADDEAGVDGLLRVLWQTYLPNRVIACATEGADQAAAVIPFLSGRTDARRATAFVCYDGTCQIPATRPSDFALQ